jgi:hypothetical protein
MFHIQDTELLDEQQFERWKAGLGVKIGRETLDVQNSREAA